MSDELSSAINAVKTYKYSFCKLVSPNDAGTTGGHQAGLYIPKNSIKLLFDYPGVKGENKEDIGRIVWFDGIESECRLKYYGTKTRNEYRITRLGKSFDEGNLVVIVKVESGEYLGFSIKNDSLIKRFLMEFNMTTEETNALIDTSNLMLSEGNQAELDASPIFPENEIPISKSYETREVNFKPKAHILALLGEELIRDPVMAIYELVKNSYDADATNVTVSFNDITSLEQADIIIIDSGLGLTEDILENVWLEPGTAHRKPLDSNGKRQIMRSPIYNRVPMGEKGVGRFAVHKLGNKIKLISRPARVVLDENRKFIRKELLDYEINLEIDWRSFTQSKYLSDVKIEWNKNLDKESFYFKEDSGTKIEIAGLKETWTRGMARQLKRHTISMVSPKNDSSKFQISLNFNNNWLDRFPDINEIIAQAPYKLTAFVDRDYNFAFEYEFLLANNNQIGTRIVKNNNSIDRNIRTHLRPLFRSYYADKGYEDEKLEYIIAEKESKSIPFGEILIELYSYDLDSSSLRDITYSPDILKKTLREQHGIKVFKDDLRVYDYGEVGNDWLGLDIKRIQNKEWFSNNQNIGFIYLDSEASGSLIEKTNREGFISNESFDFFKIIIEFILNEFRIERQRDRIKWLSFNKRSSTTITLRDRVENFVNLINDANIGDPDKKQKILDEASSIEADYEKTKETLLLPAGVGMTASVALHEIEKLVPRMEETVKTMPLDEQRIKYQVLELDGYVKGILSVLKQSGTKPIDVKEAIDQALSNYKLKFKLRKITPIVDVQNDIGPILCDKRFLVTMLMNLVDNSVHWLDTINKDDKVIFFKVYNEDGITNVIVADNGPGFKDNPEEIITPFFSRRDGGIGIGMYLIDTVMMKYGKLKIYTDNSEAGINEKYNGAIVKLIFNKNQK